MGICQPVSIVGICELVSRYGIQHPGISIPTASPSLWYGSNWETVNNPLSDIRSYQSQILNNTGKTWLTVAPLFIVANSVPGEIIGWRVRNNNDATWTNGTTRGQTSYTPDSGTWTAYTSPAILADSAVLNTPVSSGGSIIIEVVLGVGSHAAGKTATHSLPSTCLTSRRGGANQNVIESGTASWVSGYSQPWTHLYIGTDPAEGGIRKIGFCGDSLTAQIVPLADSPNTRREGYAVVASLIAAQSADAFQIISFGRGTYTTEQMATSQPYLAAELTSDHLDWMLPQGWSYNQSPTSPSSFDSTIASTQSVIDLWSAKGVRVGVNIMSPAGSSRNTETYLPYYTDAVNYWTSNQSIINLAASIADSGDPTIIDPAYSLDGIHIGNAGASIHGTAAYNQVKTLLQAQGEL